MNGILPHNPLSAVLTAACVQLDAATHNIPAQEYPFGDATGVKADLVDEPLTRDGDYLLVPDGPGIGIDLNEEGLQSTQRCLMTVHRSSIPTAV